MSGNFEQVKSNANIERVLCSGLGLNIKPSGKEFKTDCPFEKHSKSKNPFSIDQTTGAWYCFACEISGPHIINLVEKARRISFPEAIKYVEDYSNITTDTFQPAIKTQKTTQAKKEYTPEQVINCWKEASLTGNDTYFGHKKLTPPINAKFGKNPFDFESTLMPFQDIQGTFKGFVCLNVESPLKYNYIIDDSTKFMLLGQLQEEGSFYIGEGIATVQTVWEATNQSIPAIAVGGWHNMLPVLKEVTFAYPNLTPIVLLDLDKKNKVNELKAINANSLCIMPQFKNNDSKLKDFNDLHQLAGLNVVKEQIEDQTKQNHSITSTNISSEEWIMLTHIAAEHGLKDCKQLIGEDGKVNYEKICALDQQREQMEQSKNTLVGPAQQTTLESNEKHPTDKLLERISLRMIEFSTTGKIKLAGISSGFTGLDYITDGFQASSLITIGARTGMGKTWFILNLIKNITIEQKKPVALFSLEMTEEEIIIRLCSLLSKIPIKLMKNGQLDNDQFIKIKNALKKIKEAKFFIIDKSSFSNTHECCEEIKKLHQAEYIEVVFIDHIGLMHDHNNGKKSENRTTEMGSITRKLKLLAKDISIPIICLAQLNRQADNNDRPRLSHLRESGAIEQDSDQIFFLHRNDYYSEDNSTLDNIVELIVAKNRHGEQNKTVQFKHTNWLLKEADSKQTSSSNIPVPKEKSANKQVSLYTRMANGQSN